MNRLPSWFHSLAPGQFQSFQQLRERLLNILLVISACISTGMYFITLVPAIRKDIRVNMPVFSILYGILLVITIFRRAPYRLRVGILLALIYILGVFSLTQYGFNVDVGLFFLILTGMTFLLVSLRYVVLVFLACCLTIAVMAVHVVRNGLEFPMQLAQSSSTLWVGSGSVFVMTGIILILSLYILISGLQNQLVKKQTLLEEVQAAQAGLEEKDRRFNALLRGSTDMIALLAKDGTIYYASPSIERMLGYGIDEIIGQKVYDYLHPESVASASWAMTPGVPAEQIGPYLELKIRHKDGTWRVLEVVGTDIYGDPAVNGTVINCRDITDRKRIEAELRATQAELERLVAQQQHEIDTYGERLAQLVRHSPVIIYGYGWTEPKAPPFISENTLQMTGYESSGFENDTYLWLSFVHPEDRYRANEGFRRDLEEKGFASIEYRFLHRDGNYRWFREEARRVLEEVHASLEIVGFVVDITEQKQSEQAYASLVESSLQGILLSQDGRIVFANRSICDSLGFSHQEMLNLTVEQVLQHLHPDSLDDFNQIRNFMRKLSTGDINQTRFEVRWIRSDGENRWLEVNLNRMDFQSRPAFQVIVRDITAHKQAEINLLESEKLNRLLLESTQDIIMLFDANETILACNSAAARALGHPVEYLNGRIMSTIVPPSTTSLRREKFNEVFRSGTPLSFEDHRAERWFLNDFYPIKDARGFVSQVAVFSTDITARKQMEFDLLESEKINRLLLETTKDVAALINSDGTILACNSTAARALGYPIEYLMGRSIHDLILPVATAYRMDKVKEAFQTGNQLSFEDQRGGRWFINNFYPILDEEGTVSQVAIFATDITRRKEMEEELRLQKENLEVEVAARTRELRDLSQELIRAQEAERQKVARELHDEAGQLLVGLGLKLEAIRDELPKEQRVAHKHIKTARVLLIRAMKSVRSLAKSLRPPALEVAGLNTVLTDLCTEYSNLAPLDVSYTGDDIDLPEVVSIALYRFAQEALTNVLKHAKASKVEVRLVAQDDQVCLAVTDNGKGMDQDKHPGGLGLLGIQERARLLGGKVDVASSPNGTSLKICIPLVSIEGTDHEK